MQDDLISNSVSSANQRQEIQGSPVNPLSRNKARPDGRTPFRLAWLLALLATLTLEFAAADGDQTAWVVALIVGGELGIAGVFGAVARWIDSPENAIAASTTSLSTPTVRVDEEATKAPLIWILCLATIPFIIEILVRGATNSMLPLELLLLAFFRNGVLALAVFAHRTDCQWMCCSLSTFLTIFASALSAQLWLHGLVVAFAIVGIWWLMETYWDSLRGRLTAISESESSHRWLISIPLVVVSVLLGLPVAATQTHALRGFMPSSGGTDWYSESARSGVGDGDAVVSGTENIQSFAPIEDAPFMTSHEPSLYDLFDESYNEPVKIQKQERAIALANERNTKSADPHLAESKQAGREFSTLRKQSNPQRKKIGNRDSDALFYVKGRLPIHLKLETFDRFDGIDWFPEPLSANRPQLAMETLKGKPWLRLPITPAHEIYGSPETHALKIIRFDSNRIPSPTQLLRIHVDKLDRSDFYTWAQPGIVRMDRDKLPSLMVMNLHSRVVDERLISKSCIHLSGGSAAYRERGNDETIQRVRELAQDWTKDVATGWPQVQNVIKRLREEYVHDHEARPDADCDHTVAHFLFESRRGPDYQFASATVLLLRSLGISARLVSGFYVGRSRYDSRARHTPVVAENVHFWVEVFALNDCWLPIEPTPGYELLPPPPTFVERLLAASVVSWYWFVANISLILPGSMVSTWLFVQRRLIVDRIATVLWRYWPSSADRVFVQQTVRLLDRRCKRMGNPRTRGITSTRWLHRFTADLNESEQKKAREFVKLAEWSDFGPAEMDAPNSDVWVVCRDAELIWSRQRIKQATSSVHKIDDFHRTPVRFVFLYQPVIWLRKIVA